MLWNAKWFPGTNLQDLNLDWILKKISALRGGNTGQVLSKKSNKDFDFEWITGGGGGGQNGYTFTPSVSSAGVISWTNDGDLPNPEPVNIMGPQGETGPGLPVGGKPNQVPAKQSATNYDLHWVNTLFPSELGFVVDGNKSALPVAIGQYVILKNSEISGRVDGLYTASKAIPANTVIDSTYLKGPISSGGLNDLTEIQQIPVSISSTDARLKTESSATCYRCGKIAILSAMSRWNFSTTPYEPGAASQVVMSITGAPTAFAETRAIAFQGTRLFIGWLDTNGNITVRNFSADTVTNANTPISISFLYLCS